jgi:hypothetical protein
MSTIRSILRKSGKILLIILGSATAALILLAATHQIMTAFEKEGIPRRGGWLP